MPGGTALSAGSLVSAKNRLRQVKTSWVIAPPRAMDLGLKRPYLLSTHSVSLADKADGESGTCHASKTNTLGICPAPIPG